MKCIAAALLATLLASCLMDEKEFIIGRGEPIVHDDFNYVVNTIRREETIGGLKANGTFWIVEFEVTNNAVRVSHTWDNTVAYVVDRDGGLYENSPEAQKCLNSIEDFGWQPSYTTPPQTEGEGTILVFDLPKDVKRPYLMVRGETLMADFFNGNRFKKTKVKLF